LKILTLDGDYTVEEIIEYLDKNINEEEKENVQLNSQEK